MKKLIVLLFCVCGVVSAENIRATMYRNCEDFSIYKRNVSNKDSVIIDKSEDVSNNILEIKDYFGQFHKANNHSIKRLNYKYKWTSGSYNCETWIEEGWK